VPEQAKLTPRRVPRADARRNYDHLLAIARDVIAEQGTQASLRDIARRAGVGLATLYRHFPTREALLESLMRSGLMQLVERADALAASGPPAQALSDWLRELAAGAIIYRGLPSSLLTTLADPQSPLYASCVALRDAGTRLLAAAQREGTIRPDLTGNDIFALVGALSWLADQPEPISDRREHLLTVVLDGITLPDGRSGTGSMQGIRSSP
jgi:AcrR family transcriptional regulator